MAKIKNKNKLSLKQIFSISFLIFILVAVVVEVVFGTFNFQSNAAQWRDKGDLNFVIAQKCGTTSSNYVCGRKVVKVGKDNYACVWKNNHCTSVGGR